MNTFLLVLILRLCLLLSISLMQSKQSKGVQGKPVLARGKAHSFTQGKSSKPSLGCSDGTLEFSTLSSSADIWNQPHHRRLGVDQLFEYVAEVLERVYEEDTLKVRQRCVEFMRERAGELRGKVQERLSLLKYLEDSLKYRSFVEIEAEVLREWRKNALLFSLATLWCHCMLAHQFKHCGEFSQEYDRFRTFIANLSHFYFRGSLRILNIKGVDSLSLLFEDTAHQVIGGLREWRQLYGRLLELLENDCGIGINLDFDLRTLKVNQHYLSTTAAQNQLPKTTQLITEFAEEYRVHQKIGLLKRIRESFLGQITESSNRIAAELKLTRISQFEKDDILDCMIYCIVRGQVKGIGQSIQALQLLIGKNSDLLSKKGVDSYRADLQGAVQYLCEEQLTSPLIKIPKGLLSTRITFQQ